MKLTVLSENAVLYPGLEGEFGLSVYLEEGDTRLLFDAGERDANHMTPSVDIGGETGA